MRSAHEYLGEWSEASHTVQGVAETCQKRSKSQVFAGAGDVRSMLTGDFTDDSDGAAEVERSLATAAIQCEASAASRRRIAPDVVIVDACIHQGTALCQRSPGNHGGEAESQEKRRHCLR
jgi:hypothetical protein